MTPSGSPPEGAARREVLNVEQAAEFLGFRPYTVREKAKAGEIPGRKVGKEWRFSRRGLLEWLEGPEGLKRAVCEAAVGFGRASSAHQANLESKGEHHEDTVWTGGRMEDARRRLEHATNEYEGYCLKKYERENAEHYRKLAAEGRH